MSDQQPTKDPYLRELKKLRKQLNWVVFALGMIIGILLVIMTAILVAIY